VGRKRKRPRLDEQLAAALALLLPESVRSDLRDRRVPAKSIIARFEMHHVVLHTWDGSDQWWNLLPMARQDHRDRTPKDQSAVAKVKRIAPEHEAFRNRLLAKVGQVDDVTPRGRPAYRITSRGFPKRKEFRFDWKSKRYVKESADG